MPLLTIMPAEVSDNHQPVQVIIELLWRLLEYPRRHLNSIVCLPVSIQASSRTGMSVPLSFMYNIYPVLRSLAAHLTQRQPGGHVRKRHELSGKKKNRRIGSRYRFYVVYQGLRPGIYTDW